MHSLQLFTDLAKQIKPPKYKSFKHYLTRILNPHTFEFHNLNEGIVSNIIDKLAP